MKKITGIIVGALIIAAGVIFALNTLGLTSIDIFFDGWWTLLIIVPCVIGFIKSKDKTANLFGALIGIVLLLAEQNVIAYDMLARLILPVLIVLIGVKIVVTSASKKE